MREEPHPISGAIYREVGDGIVRVEDEKQGKWGLFKPDGTWLWNADVEDNISGSPVVGGNGMIYAPDGRDLLALAVTNGTPPAKSAWPMFRANPQHTGRVQIAK